MNINWQKVRFAVRDAILVTCIFIIITYLWTGIRLSWSAIAFFGGAILIANSLIVPLSLPWAVKLWEKIEREV